MQIPTAIRILDQEFVVRVVTRDEAISRHSTAHTVGQTDLNLQKITIRGPEDLSPAQAADTLLHEALHGVVYLFGFGRFLSDEDDEDFVAALSTALLHTLRDNPQLVEALMGDLSQARSGELNAD